jgi:NADH-quinone oxidoreductase chain G
MNFCVKINNNYVTVDTKLSILQVCELFKFDVPRFCYHERLSVAGNCRMCLVEIEKAPKLVASCAMPLVAGMHILTNSSAVKKAREGVLEFLLINHPLDCPICDQGGECDLQDQVMTYGSHNGRFREYKRAVDDKNCGPLVKMIMTRCIHCTRCIRFANEISGVPSIGTSGRGQTIEVGTYIKRLFSSEFSGNVIDLCPVGALTSKPFMFSARSWELRSIQSIDIGDGIGSNIRIDLRGYEIGRILPAINEHINEEWISDKTRFAFDGLKRQRLSVPLLKNGFVFKQISWLSAFETVCYQIKHNYTIGLLGSYCDFDSAISIKLIISVFGKAEFVSHLPLTKLDFCVYYTLNTKIVNFNKIDSCLLVGINPRKDGAILNLHLRKRFITSKLRLNLIGSSIDLSFPSLQVGLTAYDISTIAEGKQKTCKILRKSNNLIIIFGGSFFENIGELQGHLLLNIISKNTNFLGLNYLCTKASEINSYELGLSKTKNSLILASSFRCLIYSVGDAKLGYISNGSFSIYQGHHGNVSTMNADLILPGAAFTEKNSMFINLEGKRQYTQIALLPPNESRQDKKILLSVLSLAKYSLELCYYLEKAYCFHKKNLKNTQQHLFNKACYNINYNIRLKNLFLISGNIDNFYITDAISEASPTMVKCSKQLAEKGPFK